MPVVTKQLVGHVDNSSYPLVTVDIQLTLTTPANASGPVPVIMEFGFGPRPRPANAPPAPPPPPEGTWQQQLARKGWGYAILVPTSVQADNGAGLTRGIIGLCNKGQPRKLDDWGALRAWAWGASRALDYFETDKAVDAKRVGIEGLSRYGKAAIVAMAYDERFAIGFIGSSGAGGAKLHRRNFGEQVENVAGQGEYHWMAGNYLKYAGPLTAERPAGGRPRAGRAVRAAAGVHQRRLARGRGRVGRREGDVPGRRRRRAGVPAARQEGPRHRRVSADGDGARRRRGGLPAARRRPHDGPELADVPDVRGAVFRHVGPPSGGPTRAG